MPLTNRTKKRFGILAGLVAVLVVVLGGIYILRESQMNQQALAALDDGMQAYESEDYEAAIESFKTYLSRYSNEADAELYYAFADSRLNVPLPNGRHTAEAIRRLSLAVDLDPTHKEATELLLGLRLQVGQTIEAGQLARTILENDPGNQAAMEALILSNQISNKIDEAIKVAKEYQQLRPEEVGVARMLIRMMLQSPTHRIELVGEQGLLAELGKEQANNAGFQLMASQAYRALEKDDLAEENLSEAIKLPYTDNATATEIAAEIMRDRSRGFDAAFSYIDGLIATVEDEEIDELKFWLAQQQLFLGQPAKSIELAKAIGPDSDFHVDALALLALAADEDKDEQGVQSAVDQLKAIDDDKAKAWAKVVKALLIDEGVGAAQIRPVLLDALEVDPQNVYFRYGLSFVYRDLGEPELAAAYLVPLVQSQPAWWGAAMELSSLFERSNALGSAYRITEQTYRIHPTINPVRLRWATLKTALLPPNDPETARETLETIDGFQAELIEAIPAASDALALSRARCLGILDRKAQLKALIADLMKNSENPQVNSVCRDFNRRYELGLDLADVPSTPQENQSVLDAIAEADILVGNRQTDEAIKMVKEALKASELDQAQRDRTMLAFLDNHGLPEALPLWKKVLKASPKNASLFRAASASKVVLADEEFGPSVAEKLKEITGEEGYAWRMAELKHKALNSKNNVERARLADKIGTLIRSGYNKPDARQLLSSILLEMGNTRGALNQLSLAVDENPYHAESNMALIQLALKEQRYPVAKAALVRLTQIDNIKPAVMAEIARVADMLGERDLATALRNRPEVAPFLQPRENLARLQDALVTQQQGESERLTKELLASDDPGMLRQLAIILALYNGVDAATPALTALSQHSESDPVILARTQASIKEITGDPKAALGILASTVEQGLAKDDRGLWAQYLRLLLTQPGGLSQAVETLTKNASSQADRVTLDCFSRALTKQDQRQGILVSLGLEALQSESPQIFQQTAKLIDEDAWQSGAGTAAGIRRPGPSSKVLAALEGLRAANPDEISLQNLLTTLYILEQQFAKATTLAQRTREQFPDDAVSARLLTQAYAETQQWRLVLGAAKTWRELATPTRATLESIDLLTATALIETGDPNTALNTIRTYESDRALAISTRSMIRSGKIEDAEEILFPLIRTDSPRWRVTAIQLAVTDVLAQDPQRAGRWLSEIRPIIPADAVGERLLWAQTSFVVGQQTDDKSRQQQAFALVKSMTEQENFPPSGWLLIGVYHDGQDEDEQARKAYEKALALDPNQHQAANNLANIMMETGELAEARKMVSRAITLTQNNPRASYLDTLAQIEKRVGNNDAALELFTQAVRLDPENPLWYIDNAELLVQVERRDEARDLLRRMKRWVPSMDNAEPELLARYEKLEKTLNQ